MYGKEGKRATLRERAKDVLNQKVSVVLLQNNFKEYSITEQKIPKANCSSHDDMKVLLLRRCSSVLTM